VQTNHGHKTYEGLEPEETLNTAELSWWVVFSFLVAEEARDVNLHTANFFDIKCIMLFLFYRYLL